MAVYCLFVLFVLEWSGGDKKKKSGVMVEREEEEKDRGTKLKISQLWNYIIDDVKINCGISTHSCKIPVLLTALATVCLYICIPCLSLSLYLSISIPSPSRCLCLCVVKPPKKKAVDAFPIGAVRARPLAASG